MSETEEELIEKQLKVIVVGEPATGKTCLAARFCHEEYSRQYYPTAGIDFFLKRTVLQGDHHLRVIVWDVSGQALKSEMIDKYIYGAHAVLLTFDITNVGTFSHLAEWLATVRSIIRDSPPVLALVANKSDMEYQRAVSVDKQLRFACDNNMTSHNVSARTGENVMLCFQRVLADVLGLRLTRAEQEEQLCVVRAEIVTGNHNQPFVGLQTPPSTICCLQ